MKSDVQTPVNKAEGPTMTDAGEDVKTLMQDIGQRARAAAAQVATASAERKHAALISAADALLSTSGDILAANARDLEYGREKGLSDAMMDRLRLDEGRIRDIAGSLRAIADQRDPVGEVMAEWHRVCISSGCARRLV
jgi:glutamate-5-semialdehyde dehydrogenase